MSRKGESITLSLDATDKAALESIALELGYTWGDKANLSALVKAIAQRKVKLSIDGKEHETDHDKQGKQAIAKIAQGLHELSSILF